MGHPGWFWMFVIEGLLAVAAGAFTFFWLDDSPQLPERSGETGADKRAGARGGEKIASRLSDALRNGRVWQLALIYLTIQVAVYGLIFFLPTRCLRCWAPKSASLPRW